MIAPLERGTLDRTILSTLYLRGSVSCGRLGPLSDRRGSEDDIQSALARLAQEGLLKRTGRRVRLTPLGGKVAYALAGREPRPLASLLRDVGEELPACGHLLDLGCGPGTYLAEAAASGARLAVGLDRDAESLGLARAAASGAGRSAPLVLAEAERLPFAAEVFDRVLCVVVLPYVRETLVLREAARVLKRGGRMILTAHGPGYYLGLLCGRGVTFKRRLFGGVSLVGTFTARAALRLPGARFQNTRRISRTLAPLGVRIARVIPRGRRFGFKEGLRVVLEKSA